MSVRGQREIGAESKAVYKLSPHISRVGVSTSQAYVTLNVCEMSTVSAAKLSTSATTISRTQASGGVQPGMKCMVCGQFDRLLRCSRCKAAVYCSREHQKLDWKRHKSLCSTHSSETNLARSFTQNAISSQVLDDVRKSEFMTNNSNLNEVLFKEPVAGPSVDRFRGTYQEIRYSFLDHAQK